MLHCLNSRPQNREGKATLTKDWFTDLLIWAPFWVLFVSTFSGHFLWVLFLATFLGTFFWESFLGTWIYNIKLSFRKNLWLHIKSIHKRYFGFKVILLEMGKPKPSVSDYWIWNGVSILNNSLPVVKISQSFSVLKPQSFSLMKFSAESSFQSETHVSSFVSTIPLSK